MVEKGPSSGLGAPYVLSERGRPCPSLNLGVSDCKVMGLGYWQWHHSPNSLWAPDLWQEVDISAIQDGCDPREVRGPMAMPERTGIQLLCLWAFLAPPSPSRQHQIPLQFSLSSESSKPIKPRHLFSPKLKIGSQPQFFPWTWAGLGSLAGTPLLTLAVTLLSLSTLSWTHKAPKATVTPAQAQVPQEDPAVLTADCTTLEMNTRVHPGRRGSCGGFAVPHQGQGTCMWILCSL